MDEKPKRSHRSHRGTGQRVSRSKPGEYDWKEWEWMPRPHAGRVMTSSRRISGEGIYLQVVPGPERTWQLVRIDLYHPLARGFRTPESALAWLARAIRQGVVPQGVVVVEPHPLPEKGADADEVQPGGTGGAP